MISEDDEIEKHPILRTCIAIGTCIAGIVGILYMFYWLINTNA